MKELFTDQMGRKVACTSPPQRIVSLVPSQTEFLYELGLTNEVVAQTLFCIHPADMHAVKPRIGGTKKLHLEKIKELKPDLIIGNKEENERTQIEALEREFPVWMSDIKNLDDALQMMLALGEIVDKKKEAGHIVKQIADGFEKLKARGAGKSVLYLIWRKPWMCAGNDTFIHDMLHRCGWKNSMESQRYPELTNETIRELNPQLIFLSSEPYPFKEEHIQELTALCPHAKILLVDGELFSWYGSSLLHSATYFNQLLDIC